MTNTSKQIALAVLCTLQLSYVPALAQQWQLHDVTPAGLAAGLFAVYGSQQVGFLATSQVYGAIRDHQSGTWTSVHPDGMHGSVLLATDGDQQAGYVLPSSNFVTQAAVWSGTESSFVNLNPAGADGSQANAVWNGRQGGYAVIGGVTQGGLWSNTASSWVSLHPAGASMSVVTGMRGNQIVGYAVFGGSRRAMLWNADTLEMTSLHVEGAFSSVAGATNGKSQGGSVDFRAGTWSGTPESFHSLNPGPSYQRSFVWAMSETYQVGAAGKHNIACVWSGTPESFRILPGGSWFHDAYARGVYEEGPYAVIVGKGDDGHVASSRALVWVVPEPSSLLGLVRSSSSLGVGRGESGPWR